MSPADDNEWGLNVACGRFGGRFAEPARGRKWLLTCANASVPPTGFERNPCMPWCTSRPPTPSP